MLAKKFRLPVKNIRPGGRKNVSVGHFLVKFVHNELPHNRFGFVISNKIEKLSAKRHFWKRRFFEEVGRWPNLSLDVLFVVCKKLEDAALSDTQKELRLILQKINPSKQK